MEANSEFRFFGILRCETSIIIVIIIIMCSKVNCKQCGKPTVSVTERICSHVCMLFNDERQEEWCSNCEECLFQSSPAARLLVLFHHDRQLVNLTIYGLMYIVVWLWFACMDGTDDSQIWRKVRKMRLYKMVPDNPCSQLCCCYCCGCFGSLTEWSMRIWAQFYERERDLTISKTTDPPSHHEINEDWPRRQQDWFMIGMWYLYLTLAVSFIMIMIIARCPNWMEGCNSPCKPGQEPTLLTSTQYLPSVFGSKMTQPPSE